MVVIECVLFTIQRLFHESGFLLQECSPWAPGGLLFLSSIHDFLFHLQDDAALLQTSKRLMSTCPQPVAFRTLLHKTVSTENKEERAYFSCLRAAWEFSLGTSSQNDYVTPSSSCGAMWVLRKTDHPLSSAHLLSPKHTRVHTHTHTPHNCPRQGLINCLWEYPPKLSSFLQKHSYLILPSVTKTVAPI